MTRRSSRLGVVSVIVGTIGIFAVAACSSSSNNGGSSGSTDPSTLQGFINSYCSYVASCCGSQGLPSDGNQCRELLAVAGISNYDPNKGQACISAVQSASSSDVNWCVDTSSSSSASTACNSVTSSSSSGTGSAAPGANCNTASDCAAGPTGSTVVCQFPPNNFTSTAHQVCIVETHGKAGDGPCFGTVTTSNGTTTTNNNVNADAGAGTDPEIFCFAADGVTCDQTTSTCAALVAIGSSCAGNLQCVAGAHCDFTTENCTANAATGSPCTGDSDCVSGDYCATTCTAQGAEGAACTSFNQCASGSCVNSKCSTGGSSALGLAFLCGGTSDGG
jgi:hypothetical protein